MARVVRIAKAVAALALVAAIAAGVLAARWCYRHSRGIEVRLHNVAPRPLRSLTVNVTGHSYALGDLAPGEMTSVWVKPTNESGVEATFVTPTGETKHVPLNGYIEPGYYGWISADLTTAEARNINESIDLY